MGDGEKIQVSSEVKSETKNPSMYNVFLLNDDYTTMEFVVHVLQSIFHKNPTDANRIMLQIHYKDRGLCGTYHYEIAETKVNKVHLMAQEEGFPLRANIEST